MAASKNTVQARIDLLEKFKLVIDSLIESGTEIITTPEGELDLVEIYSEIDEVI